MMTFEELLAQACESAHLPDMAKIQLPSAISKDTQKKVMKLNAEEFGKVLATAIDTVNKGSVESIDTLVRKQLEKR